MTASACGSRATAKSLPQSRRPTRAEPSRADLAHSRARRAPERTPPRDFPVPTGGLPARSSLQPRTPASSWTRSKPSAPSTTSGTSSCDESKRRRRSRRTSRLRSPQADGAAGRDRWLPQVSKRARQHWVGAHRAVEVGHEVRAERPSSPRRGHPRGQLAPRRGDVRRRRSRSVHRSFRGLYRRAP